MSSGLLIPVFEQEYSNKENFPPKVFWSLFSTFSLVIVWKKDVMTYVCLNTVIQILSMWLDFDTAWSDFTLLTGFDVLKIGSDW